jgi:trans-aconitate methyltransferase
MSGFTREWLRLRAPHDEAARSVALGKRFASALPPSPRVADLGAGSGAQAAWLRRYTPADTRWTLIDRDEVLIDDARFGDREVADLAAGLARIDASRFDAATCSAFLDLVSAAWLNELVEWLGMRPFLASLTVDGRIAWDPPDEDDARISKAFRSDQSRDKGFGSALGQEAAPTLVDCLRRAGARVETAWSDWILGPTDEAMLVAMIDWHADTAADSAAWRQRRKDAARRGALRLTVGHLDVLKP